MLLSREVDIREELIRYLSNNIEDYPEGIILPIDKPYRWTSADVIRKVKYAACRHFGKKKLKVGHAGTLDPLATGILLVCIGPATKKAEELQASAKQYVAGVTFGATTPSYDLEKDIDRQLPLDGVSEESIRSILPKFIGEQEQVAPLFSAKSVDGVRAYETARKLYRQSIATGEDFDHSAAGLLQTNLINIYDLELLEYSVPAAVRSLPDSAQSLPDSSLTEFFSPSPNTNVPEADTPSEPVSTPGHVRGWGPLDASSEGTPQTVGGMERVSRAEGLEGVSAAGKGRINVADISGYELPTASIRVDCSKGTYVRAFARDLGEALGSGAFLSSLRRTKNGGFTIEDAISLESALELLG